MRWVVDLLLVSAAGLKAVELVTEPAATLTNPLGRWFLPMQVGVELGLGLVVISGLYWRYVRWAALVLFTIFAVYSLSLALGGAASCGCFGPVKVHPWWTFLVDVAVVIGLLLSVWHHHREAREPEAARTLSAWFSQPALTAVILGASGISIVLLARYADSRVATADDLLSTAGGLVVLEPEAWIGKPLPIAESIDLDLTQGPWTLLLHRHDCPDCQEAVPRYEQRALREQVALVEVPPFGESHVSARGPAQRGRLTDEREWFVQTPVEIQLRDGLVTAVNNNHGE